MTAPVATPRTDILMKLIRGLVNAHGEEHLALRDGIQAAIEEMEGGLAEANLRLSEVTNQRDELAKWQGSEAALALQERNAALAERDELREMNNRFAKDAEEHYQPQIDQCIREINELRSYAEENERLLRRVAAAGRTYCGVGWRDVMLPIELLEAIDAALAKNPGAKCPIGLDEHPEIGSAVGCSNPICAEKGKPEVLPEIEKTVPTIGVRSGLDELRQMIESNEDVSDTHVTVTTNEAGECVAVTRTDDEGRILSVIWERPKSVHQVFLAYDGEVPWDELSPEHQADWKARTSYDVAAARRVMERLQAMFRGEAPECPHDRWLRGTLQEMLNNMPGGVCWPPPYTRLKFHAIGRDKEPTP